jgi:flagellar hook-associated protein 2
MTSVSASTTSSSSIDWSKLIDGMVAAKLARASSLQSKIKTNQTRISAYQQLQSLLAKVKTAAEALHDPAGSSSSNVFLSRTATLTASGGTNASSVLGVTLGSGAALGSHSLTVSQLAQAHKVAGAVMSGKATALGHDGVIALGLAGGTGVEITIDGSMTLADIANAINAKTATSGVRASLVQVSSGQYEMVLTATSSNRTITASSVSGENVLAGLGITGGDGGFANELQAPKPAIITLDGVTITRDSNEIGDVIDGVTFNLYQPTKDSTITLGIADDTSAIKSAIEGLVDAYNSLRDFIYQQQQVDSSGAAASNAVLFGDTTLRAIAGAVGKALNTSIGGLSLATLGLKFDETNHLELDTSKLEKVLASNLDGVKKLLGFDKSTSSKGIADLIYDISAAASDTTSGSLETLVDGLESVNAELQAQIGDVEARAATYRENLTAQYARYQAAIQAAESTMDYLTALLNANSRNN